MELKSATTDKQISTAMNKILALAAQGESMSSLFPDVLNKMSVTSFGVKKLLYLYITHYSSSDPELAAMSVNALVHDTSSSNPLIRALAIKTMSSIPVESVMSMVLKPAAAMTSDSDAFVRIHACRALVKVFCYSRETAFSIDLPNLLAKCLNDSNAQVVTTAVSCINIIHSELARGGFTDQANLIANLFTENIRTIIPGLKETTEWGVMAVCEATSRFINTFDEALLLPLSQQLIPYLSHSDMALVLSTAKCLMGIAAKVKSAEINKAIVDAIIAIISASEWPEMTIEALRIALEIIETDKEPFIPHYNLFFCRFNDYVGVKLFKLNCLAAVGTAETCDLILYELKSYIQEIDVEVSRAAVDAVGKLCIHLTDEAADKCVSVLTEIVKNSDEAQYHIIQAAIVTLEQIFRRVPGRYDSIVPMLCSKATVLDVKTKIAFLAILTRFAEHIRNLSMVIEQFVDNFLDETPDTQIVIIEASFASLDTDLVSKLQKFMTKIETTQVRDHFYMLLRLHDIEPSVPQTPVNEAHEADESDELIPANATLPPAPMLVAAAPAPAAPVDSLDDLLGLSITPQLAATPAPTSQAASMTPSDFSQSGSGNLEDLLGL